MAFSPITESDLHLLGLHGSVRVLEDCVLVRVPDNPLYHWGNFLLLSGPPGAEEIETRAVQARGLFQDQPDIRHVTLRWDGEGLSTEAAARAQGLGFQEDSGLELRASALKKVQASGLEVRALEWPGAWARIEAFNRLCDPDEQDAEPDYGQFKQNIRRSWQSWLSAGAACWWGAFLDDQLVGQAGMVVCPGGRGRFQSVETHPEFRRRGVCSSLISAVGNDALTRLRCREVLLEADPEGPALGLYRRLGFRDGTRSHGIVASESVRRIHDERPADRAELRSVSQVVFGGPGEAELVESLRGHPGVLSLVASRLGSVEGHALFSPVRLPAGAGQALSALALGPLWVRPNLQRAGVGSALVKAGLARCRAAGHGAVFVLGDPAYYGRFGWRPASEWGLRCKWPGSEAAFQAMELKPGALSGCQGQVAYHPAFDGL